MFLLCFSSSFFFKFSKHSYLCNKKKITRLFEHMKFIFSWKKKITRSLCSLTKYFFHSKINFICSRHRLTSSIYSIFCDALPMPFSLMQPATPHLFNQPTAQRRISPTEHIGNMRGVFKVKVFSSFGDLKLNVC